MTELTQLLKLIDEQLKRNLARQEEVNKKVEELIERLEAGDNLDDK
jgi:SOS response regulatory protein OraA/RecX